MDRYVRIPRALSMLKPADLPVPIKPLQLPQEPFALDVADVVGVADLFALIHVKLL
ncbi:hypothetical protein [Pandoraea aquatica]|uniref:hypothetical protein n=1 Tax=Pandoraea aquatica TaxID=2508290 RepID=UPI001581A00C|nr:hypothetical protein [Pandoraea aquatica]